jgi:hypothetical protein
VPARFLPLSAVDCAPDSLRCRNVVATRQKAENVECFVWSLFSPIATCQNGFAAAMFRAYDQLVSTRSASESFRRRRIVAMIDQAKVVRFNHSIKSDLVFSISVSLVAVAATAILAIADRHRLRGMVADPLLLLVLALATVAYMLAMVAWIQVQRVEIDTEKQIVRFANSETCHLWRMFSLNDAVSIQALEGRKGRRGIGISLRTSSSRRWDTIYLNNIDGVDDPDPIDSPLFLALVQHIRRIHPDMKITGMPKTYRGNLPTDICVFDRRC